MKMYPTPHINASPEDFAKTVLMPGDPLRAKFIAENYLDNPVLINSVRGMLAYTGSYKGKKITVMAKMTVKNTIAVIIFDFFALCANSSCLSSKISASGFFISLITASF